MTLTDTVALITGGKRIGGVIADQLAQRGVHVALAYARSASEANATAATVRGHGRRAETFRVDLADAAQCEALVNNAANTFGRLDIVINMASVYKSKPFDTLTAEDWDETNAVDLRAAFLCSRYAVPHLRRQHGGRIINFSDWVARSGRPRYPGFLPYYVAKAGIIALTEGLALELAADNILVNAIAPGPIVAPPGTSEEESREVAAATPLGRWGGEIEIAKAVLALLDSDFITGETIRVDGGRHVK
jgi:NAD(P)-dependent dehydrogenase (short-subunit alcohol dehydrogenase family)